MTAPNDPKLMRVGELAKAVGKTVRAMHLYEELGLLEPRARSEGGFRLYGVEAIDRIHWIVKLQAIGFTLAEIQGFVRDFQGAGSAREASTNVRALFTEKQAQIREQIIQLQVIENDLSEALAYLDACQTCTDQTGPTACGDCGHQGHSRGAAPPLFAGLSRRSAPELIAIAGPATQSAQAAPCDAAGDKPFDVSVSVLYREGNN